MEVVVTGASGFLGRAVARKLRAAGNKVHAVSRSASSDTTQVRDYADSPPADGLIHLAGIANRQQAEEAGVAYENAAAATLASLLGKGYSHVVYASSAALYGDQNESPCGATTPVVAADRYSRIKLDAEREVLRAQGRVVRLSNVYGPGMPEGTVLHTILGQIPGSGALYVQDEGPIRDFIWLDDAASAFELLLVHRPAGVFNVGSGKGISVRDLARVALEIAGQAQRPVHATASRNRRSHLVVDIEPTCAALRWRPTVSIREGLTRLLDARQ